MSSVALNKTGYLLCPSNLLPTWATDLPLNIFVDSLLLPNQDAEVLAVFKVHGGTDKFPVIWKDSQGHLRSGLNFDRLINLYLDEKYCAPSSPTLASYLPWDYNQYVPYFLRRIFLDMLGRVQSKIKLPAFPAFPRASLVQLLLHLQKQIEPQVSQRCVSMPAPVAILTHDVDSDWILKNNYWLDYFIDLENSLNFPACWYIVGQAFKNRSNQKFVQKIIDAGHEIGIHGYAHLGNLGHLSASDLDKELGKISPILKDYPMIKGFRSPWYCRSQLLMQKLSQYFSYDSSVPECQLQFSQVRGTLTNAPFYYGNLLELPITLPDETYRYLLRLNPTDYYNYLSAKIDFLVRSNGLINIVQHPFPHFSADKSMAQAYAVFLKKVSDHHQIQKQLPCDLAATVQKAKTLF